MNEIDKSLWKSLLQKRTAVRSLGEDSLGSPFEDSDFVMSAVASEFKNSHTSVQGWVESLRKGDLELPVKSGSRVKFVAGLQALLSYRECPEPGEGGTVVEVKVSGGKVTSHEGMVYVKWDRAGFQPVWSQHLSFGEPVRRSASMVRVASCALDSFLEDFVKVAGDVLINRASQDLWSLTQDGDEFVIARLFDDEGHPLKI